MCKITTKISCSWFLIFAIWYKTAELLIYFLHKIRKPQYFCWHKPEAFPAERVFTSVALIPYSCNSNLSDLYSKHPLYWTSLCCLQKYLRSYQETSHIGIPLVNVKFEPCRVFSPFPSWTAAMNVSRRFLQTVTWRVSCVMRFICSNPSPRETVVPWQRSHRNWPLCPSPPEPQLEWVQRMLNFEN